MLTRGESSRTLEDLNSSKTLNALADLIETMKPNELIDSKALEAVNNAVKELEIKGGEVKEMTRGQMWQFQDVYKYLYNCAWHCVSIKTCKFKGMAARAEVRNGKLVFDYVGCGRFFAMRRAFRWITSKKQADVLKEARNLGKELEDFTLEEWRLVLGEQWYFVVSGRFDE